MYQTCTQALDDLNTLIVLKIPGASTAYVQEHRLLYTSFNNEHVFWSTLYAVIFNHHKFQQPNCKIHLPDMVSALKIPSMRDMILQYLPIEEATEYIAFTNVCATFWENTIYVGTYNTYHDAVLRLATIHHL